MGRVVGIDFGDVRIGIAISDERRIIAQPVGAIRAAKTLPLTCALIKLELTRYNSIDLLVVGHPLLLSGKEGDMALKAKAFGNALSETLEIPVIFWDERLTSAQVDRMLRDSDVKRKKRAALSDQLAAVTILQNYLESL